MGQSYDNPRVKLFNNLFNHFDREELKILCDIYLWIESETLGSEDRRSIVRELIKRCEKTNRIEELLTAARQLRPDIDNWPKASEFALTKQITTLLSGLESKDQQDAKSISLSKSVLEAVVDNLNDQSCWYLLKVANKEMRIDEHTRIFNENVETVGTGDIAEISKQAMYTGYVTGIANLKNIIFQTKPKSDDDMTLTIQVSPEILELITRKLKISE